MTEYINKAAATSVCNTQRAYGTMQIIADLPKAKVVDEQQFEQACNDVYDDSEMWKNAPLEYINDVMRIMEEVNKRLFGGAK